MNTCQKELHCLQNQWWLDRAKEVEQHVERHNSRSFFQVVKFVFQWHQSDISPITDDPSNRLTEKENILAHWKQHLIDLLNQPGIANFSVIDELPENYLLSELEIPPSIKEVKAALTHLADNKVPGPDCIPAEVFKASGPALLTELLNNLLSIWEAEWVTQELKNGHIIPIFKKHYHFTCGNYRGITLLSVISTLFAQVILNRVWLCIEKHLLKVQCSFRERHSTSDMMVVI